MSGKQAQQKIYLDGVVARVTLDRSSYSASQQDDYQCDDDNHKQDHQDGDLGEEGQA